MGARGQNSKLILAAMIFAVPMIFIDQTIVAITVPSIQKDLSLTSTGVQWIINGYLLALSALFAFGGRRADRLARRALADRLPPDPGSRRGAALPGGAGDRPRRFPDPRARPRDGDLSSPSPAA
jgi:MFS family permease